jgi:hypothetical protein
MRGCIGRLLSGFGGQAGIMRIIRD